MKVRVQFLCNQICPSGSGILVAGAEHGGVLIASYAVSAGDGIADKFDSSRAVEGRIAKLRTVAEKCDRIEFKLRLALGDLQPQCALFRAELYGVVDEVIHHLQDVVLTGKNIKTCHNKD